MFRQRVGGEQATSYYLNQRRLTSGLESVKFAVFYNWFSRVNVMLCFLTLYDILESPRWTPWWPHKPCCQGPSLSFCYTASACTLHDTCDPALINRYQICILIGLFVYRLYAFAPLMFMEADLGLAEHVTTYSHPQQITHMSCTWNVIIWVLYDCWKW